MRKQPSRPILFGAAILAVAVLAATPASGQYISYAAKFVCGGLASPPPAPLADGQYRTIINIHNPHYLKDVAGLPVPLFLEKKVVLSMPQGQPPLDPSCKLSERLAADHSMRVSCTEIRNQLALSGLPATGYLEGFVVLEVGVQPFVEPPIPPELDVVAVYSSRPRGGQVSTMDVERISPTQIIGTPIQDPCAPD